MVIHGHPFWHSSHRVDEAFQNILLCFGAQGSDGQSCQINGP